MDFTAVVVTLGVLVGIEVIYTIYHFWSKHQQQTAVFQNWGEHSSSGSFSKDELAFIKEQTQEHYEPFQVDDITWNDLDMDIVYQQMNQCLSAAGDQALYHMLRNPLYDPAAITQRHAMLEWAMNDEAGRNLIRSALIKTDSRGEIAIDALYTKPKNVKMISQPLVYILAGLPVFFLITGIFYWPILTYAFLIGFINCFLANSIRKNMADDFDSALYLYSYARSLQAISKASLPPFIQDQYPLKKTAKALGSIKRSLFPDIHSGDGFFLLIIGNALLGEAFTYYRLRDHLFQHRKNIETAVTIIGEMDALISTASYYQTLTKTCTAEFVSDHILEAKTMIHPLLENPVPNDVDLHQNILISGSNASGKSTYLKMIAINTIFAQSFGFALAASYRACIFQIYTSMSLRDSLETNDSYFVAEIKSIKRILDHIHDEIPILCMIDEILRGTNTGERIAAASEVLMALSRSQALCLAATHDLELTRILSNHYQNRHFTESLQDDQMQFDYHIHEGASHSRNALALLTRLDFDRNVVKQAEEQLQYYETNGVWKKLREVSRHEK